MITLFKRKGQKRPTAVEQVQKVPKNIKKAMKDIKTCSEALKEANTTINNQEQLIATSNDKLTDWHERLDVATENIEMQKNSIDELMAKVAEAKTAMEVNAKQKEMIADLGATYAKLDADYASQKQMSENEIEGLKDNIAEMDKVCGEAANKVKTQDKTIGELAKANSEAGQVIKELKAENKKLKFNQKEQA